MELQECIDKINNLIFFDNTLTQNYKALSVSEQKYKKNIQSLKSDIEDLETASKYYKKGVDFIYEKTVQSLETQLSQLMQEAFSGCNYGIHFSIEDMRGTKNMLIEFLDDNFQGDPEDFGGSLETVAGYLFHLMYLIKSGRPRILFMDEMFKDLHPAHLQSLISLISKLAKANNCVNVLITHSEELECIADKMYVVDNGEYTEVEV